MSVAVVLLQFWVCDNLCWTLCCHYCVTSSQSDSQIHVTAVTALSYSQYHQTGNCTNTCEAPIIPFFQSLIVPWWKLIYYVCILFCTQNTKIYKKTWEITIQGLGTAEDYILCPDWMTVFFFFNSFHFHWCLFQAGLLTAQPTFTETLSADSIKSSSLALPWYLVSFSYLSECDGKNFQNLLKFFSGSTWATLIGMAGSTAGMQL